MTESTLPRLATLVTPRRTALVVVDVQNDFCDPVSYPMAAEIIPRLQQLLVAARAAGVMIVYTQAVHTERTDSPVWVSRQARRPRPVAACQEGSPGVEIHPQVTPGPGDTVVRKYRHSAFVGTSFEVILRAQGIESLVFTGLTTNGCVESSARDAFQRDYWTIVIPDCTAAATMELHEGALRGMEWNCAILASSSALIDIWSRGA